MKDARSVIMTAVALTLFVSACSQPEDVQSPTLTPQFGTTGTDVGVDVAFSPAGGSYSLSRQSGLYDQTEYYNKIILRNYSSSGSQIWEKTVALLEDSLITSSDYPSLLTGAVQSSDTAEAYVLFGRRQVFQDIGTATDYKVAVYSPGGTLTRSFLVGTSGSNFSGVEVLPKMAIDSWSNTYIGIVQADLNPEGPSISTTNLLRKYSYLGSPVWERASSVGVPTGVATSSDGSVYVAGRNGLARYNGSGTLLWKKSGFYYGVAVSGSSVFAHSKNTVYAFSASGQQKGSYLVGGLSGAIIQDLSGDGAGGVLVSGKYAAGKGNWNAFVRKLSAAGSSQWTSTYGTPVYDDAQGVVGHGNEIYVTGTTLGSLAHTNRGKEDGYVRKLDVGGKPIWTR